MTYCHIRLGCVSSAPLGRDSVPEVYISRTGSSSATSTSGGAPSWSNHACTSTQPSGTSPPASRTTARWSTPSSAARAPRRRRRRARPRPRTPRAPLWLEDERDLLGAEHEVDRHQHHPGPGGGEVEHRELPAVVAEQREPVALAEPGGGDRRGGAVDGGVELGEGERVVAVDDRRLVGEPLRGAPRQVAERLLPGLLDQVRDVRHAWRTYARARAPARAASWSSGTS